MKKILVIEDCAATRNIFLDLLNAKGYCAIGAENGFIGVQQVQKQLPDLILCDIMMPQIDGYGVLTTLRTDPSSAIIPFIFLTAKVTQADIRLGMELGADDYLTKPCKSEELLRAIAARLEKQAVLRQWCAIQSQPAPEPPSADRRFLQSGRNPHITDNSLNFQTGQNGSALCVNGIGDTARPATPQSIFPSDSQLTEIFQFIEASYHQSIGLNEVAQAFGYSPSYLTGLVRLKTGQTLNHWIIKRRMAAAQALLINTNQSANQIAEAVGYQNAGHFFRQFRQYYGLTPQTWRKAYLTQVSSNKEQQNC